MLGHICKLYLNWVLFQFWPLTTVPAIDLIFFFFNKKVDSGSSIWFLPTDQQRLQAVCKIRLQVTC